MENEITQIGQSVVSEVSMVDALLHLVVSSPWAAVAGFGLYLAYQKGFPFLRAFMAKRNHLVKSQDRKDTEQDSRMDGLQKRQDTIEASLDEHERLCEARHKRIDKRLEQIEDDNKKLISTSGEIKGQLSVLIDQLKK